MKYLCLILLLSFSASLDAATLISEELKDENESEVWTEEKTVEGKKIRVLKINKPISMMVDSVVIDDGPTSCEIEVSTDYWQENDKVEMEAYLHTADCGAAHGAYKVSVRTKNEIGEYHTMKYPEVWRRDNAQPIKLTHSYSMKGDTDLVGVQVKLALDGSCVCGLNSHLNSESDSN